MSSFKNVSDVDLEVQVDGRRYFAPAGEEITVPDEFDYQFQYQPAWGGEEFVAPVEPVEEPVEEPKVVKPDQKTKTTEAVPAASEEKK